MSEGAFILATVGGVYSDGASLIFDGQTEETQKHYKRLSTYRTTVGARVLVARVGGSCVILGSLY